MLLMILASACGMGPWDIDNETDRLAMQQEIKNALTQANCSTALVLATTLFQSKYSDNEIRMLYASAHGCNMGISLYDLLDDITTSDFTSQDAIFKTLVRLFPSKSATDTRLQSAMLAQDALHSILSMGVVVGASDRYYGAGFNPASVLKRDRTDDANIYLTFTSMGLVGSGLNRYGFNAADDPATFGYSQQVDLTWTTQNAIKADTSGEGCAIASGILNMLDGIDVLAALAPGSVASALTQITAQLQVAMSAAAHFTCDPLHGVAACNAALVRLRFRGACTELDPNAASAAGIIGAINLGWN